MRTDDPIYKRDRIVVDQERVPADGGTAIKLYLREIGKVKPLTPQAEIELAARIKKGDKEGARTDGQGQSAPGDQDRPRL